MNLFLWKNCIRHNFFSYCVSCLKTCLEGICNYFPWYTPLILAYSYAYAPFPLKPKSLLSDLFCWSVCMPLHWFLKSPVREQMSNDVIMWRNVFMWTLSLRYKIGRSWKASFHFWRRQNFPRAFFFFWVKRSKTPRRRFLLLCCTHRDEIGIDLFIWLWVRVQTSTFLKMSKWCFSTECLRFG